MLADVFRARALSIFTPVASLAQTLIYVDLVYCSLAYCFHKQVRWWMERGWMEQRFQFFLGREWTQLLWRPRLLEVNYLAFKISCPLPSVSEWMEPQTLFWGGESGGKGLLLLGRGAGVFVLPYFHFETESPVAQAILELPTYQKQWLWTFDPPAPTSGLLECWDNRPVPSCPVWRDAGDWAQSSVCHRQVITNWANPQPKKGL